MTMKINQLLEKNKTNINIRAVRKTIKKNARNKNLESKS
ncbi:hypothetical protein SAMN05443543_103363 [Flavobacterium flevense]|nr:hypothetical protein SAMN05443543_103363 [Flavobacterium flevense]